MKENKFASNLKKIRKEYNLSQEDLSSKINVSKQTISKYEKGIAEPNFHTLIEISRSFDCSLDSLVFGEVQVKDKNPIELKLLLERRIDELKSELSFIINDYFEYENIKSDNDTYNEEISEELVPNISNIKYFNNKKVNSIDLDFYRSKNSNIYNCLNCNDKSTIPIPKVGNISAGTPMYACEDIESYFNLSMDDLSYPTDEYFILQVNGESMNKIYKDEDYILVHKTRSLVPNKPMIALVDGEDATMKYVEITDCDFTLIPHSDEKHFEPVTYSTSEYKLDILGEVVGVINELKEE